MKLLILFLTFFVNNVSFAQISDLDQSTIDKLYEYETMKPECAYLTNRLKTVNVEYINFDNKLETGKIIVLDSVAKHVEKLFIDLKNINFNVYGVDPFSGFKMGKFLFWTTKEIDDDYNYTGCFVCKTITLTKNRSIYSFGLGIAINPLMNPYVGIDLIDKKITVVIPKNGIKHVNRYPVRPNKENRIGIVNKHVVKIFRQNGFHIWGGNWDFPINYMQFHTSFQMAKLLIAMTPEDSIKFFDLNVEYLNKNSERSIQNKDLSDAILEYYFMEPSGKIDKIIAKYNQDKEEFFIDLQDIFNSK